MNQSEKKSIEASQSGGFLPLTSWFPLCILPLMLLIRFIPNFIDNGPAMMWMLPSFGPALFGLVIIFWWLSFSRANWLERIGGLLGIVVILVLSQVLGHQSMQGGPLLVVMTLPLAVAGFAIGTFLFGQQLTGMRTVKALMIAVLASAVSVFVKSDGAWGDFSFELQPRWSESSEEQFLAQHLANAEAVVDFEVPLNAFENATWPTFRGPNQDGVARGFVVAADLQANPPKELWRIAVGPAWSSFVAAGKYLFTQEQRGENESVLCYDGETGKQLWEQGLPSRFFEGLGGLGPRSTPTLQGQFLYTLGAEGWLRKLNARNGQVVWKVDVRKQAAMDIPPMWGYSSSPLVYADKVVVHAGGQEGKGVLAFNDSDGSLAWYAASGKDSYSSVQLVTLLDKKYLCLLSEQGAHLWEPETGKLVYDYNWPHTGYRSLQPQVVDGDKLLIGTGMGTGTRLIQFSEADGSLAAEEIWTSLNMKPDFNDFLVHKGHLYGFDNLIFACVDLSDGKRKWKGGRYDKGQALLLADSDLIVVVTEKGELVLLRTNPNKLEEVFKIQALDGKTWNHPIVVGDKLYLRNAKEAVCYQLPINAAG